MAALKRSAEPEHPSGAADEALHILAKDINSGPRGQVWTRSQQIADHAGYTDFL